jgi:hypothetical protein
MSDQPETRSTSVALGLFFMNDNFQWVMSTTVPYQSDLIYGNKQMLDKLKKYVRKQRMEARRLFIVSTNSSARAELYDLGIFDNSKQSLRVIDAEKL